MRKHIVAGNWKMNTTVAEGVELAKAVVEASAEVPADVKLIIAPPFTHLYPVAEVVKGTAVALSAQNCADHVKGAYTGDLLIYCRTALLNEAVTPFLSNWMRNVADDQKDSGVVTITAPYTKLYNTLMTNLTASFGDTELTGVAGWSDAAVWIPYTMYQVTGDTVVLREYYDVMKRWTDWIIRTAGDDRLWNTGFHFGEWLIPSQKAGRGEEFEAALFTEVYGFLQEPAFTGGPEDERVSFRLYLLEGCDGEGEFLADVRIAMFDDGAVEVYCDDHLVVCWVGQYFHKVTSEGAGRYDDDAADVDHDALVACALDFYECTLKAVELASVDTYSCALGEVDFVRTEEEDAFGC